MLFSFVRIWKITKLFATIYYYYYYYYIINLILLFPPNWSFFGTHSESFDRLRQSWTSFSMFRSWCGRSWNNKTWKITLLFDHIPSGLSNSCSLVKLTQDGWMGGWMDVWVDGCVSGWMCGRMDVWVGGWMCGWMDVWVDGCVGGWMAGSMDGWMVGSMDGRMDGWPCTWAKMERL